MKTMNAKIAGKLRVAGILVAVVGALTWVLTSPHDVMSSTVDGGELASDPWTLSPAVDVAAVKSGSLDFGIDGAPTALQSGTVLMAVDVESAAEGALIHFHADGELALARTFTLEQPARLVVDLPGIRGDLPSQEFVLGGDYVVSVRVGVHPGKLRVVIDGGSGAETFSNYKAIPSIDGLYVMVGAGADLELQLESRLSGIGLAGDFEEEMFLLEGGPEPVLVAMRGVDEDGAMVDLWDDLGEAPADEEILARISDPYTDIDIVEADAILAAELAELEALEAAEMTEADLAAESAMDVWGLESNDEATSEADLMVETTSVELEPETSVVAEAGLADGAAAIAAEEAASAEAFWARAGKPVETRISDLHLAAETTAEPLQVAMVSAEPVEAVSVFAEPARDPWALDPAEASFLAADPPPVPVELPVAAEFELAATAPPTAPPTATETPEPAPAPKAKKAPEPAPAAAAAAAPAVSSEAPARSVEIFGLQFDRDSARDRIAILGDGVADYQLFEPDDETLIILLGSAVLSEGMAERITPEFGGPISQVTIFQQPDIEGNEVRVVLRRADKLSPNIYQRGSLLLVDFPNSGVAARLPVALIPDGGEDAEEAVAEEVIEGEVAQEEEAAPVALGMPEIVDPEDPEDVIAVAPELIDASGEVSAGNGGPAEESSSFAPGGTLDEQEFRGSPISLDFKDVPIMDVLRLIAEVSELNIIAGDDVTGAITLRLVEVPWDQALDIILVTRGLGYVRVGNVLRIAPAEMLQAEEAERLQERRNKEQLEDLEVKLQPVNYAAVDDVKELVRRLLSPRGTVNTDQRTNTVIIKDIPSVIAEATALIEALDTQTPQVMIEAKIVEAALDFGRELGTSWGVGTNPDAGPIQTGGVTWDGANNVSFSNGISSLPTGAASMGFLLLDDNVRIDVEVQAMEEAGEGKVISSPRVVTLDNREALIEQGVSIPFQTFEGGDAKLEFVDAVLSLKVTPHITPDESIIMALEVTRNAPDSGVKTPTGSPAIAKNQAKTETLVKNGQTLVIGGIYTIDTSTTESRVPYLYKIPVLGAAFKSRRVSDSRKELLIFITPRIVVNPALADN